MARDTRAGAPDPALESAILAAPIEVRERLARHFAPSVLRAARIAERDETLMRMAVGLAGDATAMAEQVHATLSRYYGSAWRYESTRPAPADQRHALAHRALRLNDGAAPSARSLRRLFAPVAKNSGGNGHGDRR
jgi:hypothetical protein